MNEDQTNISAPSPSVVQID